MADIVGTPVDLDDSDLETAALKRSDDEAANDTRPEPTFVPKITVPTDGDVFERLDDEDYVDPDTQDQYSEPLELEFNLGEAEEIEEEL